jgi:type IV pilus assembly protein PilQ
MNARLSSLLVAGGVVLAGIQSGSLNGAIPETGSPKGAAVLQGASLLPQTGGQSALKLEIPGFSGVPRLQVLANPSRVVVDLPGVERGERPSKKDVLGLTSPLVLRSRIAQFLRTPEMVTRLVLEVAPGTVVDVSSDGTGVLISMNPGSGAVKAQFTKAPAAQTMETETVAAKVAAPAAVEPAAVEAPVLALSTAPAVAALPAPAPQALTLAAPAPLLAAPILAPVPAAVPVPAAPRQASLPLTPVPAVGVPFQSLPALVVSALLPSTPVVQDRTPAAPAAPVREGRPESRTGRTLGDSALRYTGTRMTIDVVNTDLISFLRIIADVAKLNLIADSDVQGIYTFKFVDAPWDQVLDVILKQAGLGKEISNGIIRVAKVEKLQKEEEDRKRLDDAKALSGETQSITRPLSFAKAQEARGILDKVLTKRGSIIIDERTNTLIISDLARNLPLIDDLIATLDVQIQQVQIEARVVEASKNFDKAFGVKWPTSNSGDAKLSVNGADATWGAYNGSSWNSINNRATDGNSAAVAFAPGKDGATSISGSTGEFWVSFLSSRVSLNVILQAMEKEGTVKIISSPKIVTQNNKKAKVLSGAKIPYPAQQAGNATGAITVSFADANLELEVTPQITNDGTILMDIHVEKADADFGRLVGSTPTITRKMIETQVLVRDGGTAIMGGVYKNTSSSSTSGVPFLSKLPIIGFLFRNKVDQDANDELLVFITPRIIKN